MEPYRAARDRVPPSKLRFNEDFMKQLRGPERSGSAPTPVENRRSM